MRRALGLPPAAGNGSSSAIAPSRLLGWLAGGVAHAQEPRPQPAPGSARAPDAAKVRQLEEALRKYEADSRRLTNKLDQLKQQDDRSRSTSQQPLIKSW
jgi:hypothetical protein